MSEPPTLRIIRGGECPPALRPGVERAIETCLRSISAELRTLQKCAEEGLDDDDLASEIGNTIASVQLARLTLERRKVGM